MFVFFILKLFQNYAEIFRATAVTRICCVTEIKVFFYNEHDLMTSRADAISALLDESQDAQVWLRVTSRASVVVHVGCVYQERLL